MFAESQTVKVVYKRLPCNQFKTEMLFCWLLNNVINILKYEIKLYLDFNVRLLNPMRFLIDETLWRLADVRHGVDVDIWVRIYVPDVVRAFKAHVDIFACNITLWSYKQGHFRTFKIVVYNISAVVIYTSI